MVISIIIKNFISEINFSFIKMDALPLEIFFQLSLYLSIIDLSFLQRVNRQFNQIFSHFFHQRINLLQWSITVDFAKTSSHHLKLHRCWIKIGWFNLREIFWNSNGSKIPISEIFEECSQCPDYLPDKRFSLVMSGTGGPQVLILLSCRHEGYLTISKGYVPNITGIYSVFPDLNRTDDLIIQTSCLLGNDLPMKYLNRKIDRHQIFTPLDLSSSKERERLFETKDQIIYRNIQNHWMDIYKQFLI